ncbi:MMPL family transporter [Streptomyces sp. NPDC052727]|uniref:MMPL family transporter n=1 Tax=Streptomyces sp. NPDC052727 TaxID=3154854 RepID=UPI00342CEAB3
MEQTGPVVSILPILVMAVLFGLAMDYEVFMVSRMREAYVHGATPRDAILSGSRHASRVVTAAALIMFAVFASFVPGAGSMIKPVAFALAFGVFVDAFLVRMTLVPAVLALVGRSAWWLPRWLDRLLPEVDIEGERLHDGRSAKAVGHGPGEPVTAGSGFEGGPF